MIFVTVGTWRTGYDRLIKAVDEAVQNHQIQEEVIAQVGNGTYVPRYFKTIDFCSPEEFKSYIAAATVVVSHAGIGTIEGAISCGKPIVVLPRKPELAEVDNDHQFLTAEQLEQEGKVLVAYETAQLSEKLKQANDFIPTCGDGASGIIQCIEEYIKEIKCRKNRNGKLFNRLFRRAWPYTILFRTDEDIKQDIIRIMKHFINEQKKFELVVFIPNAGLYLGRLFSEINSWADQVQYVTVRRASTVKKDNAIKKVIFKNRVLSDFFRHIEVLWRLLKWYLKVPQKMISECKIDFDVKGKRVLVIDDSCETGSTIKAVETLLMSHGASSVTKACISRDLVPRKAPVDYSVYDFKLLRTRNSRDYTVDPRHDRSDTCTLQTIRPNTEAESQLEQAE